MEEARWIDTTVGGYIRDLLGPSPILHEARVGKLSWDSKRRLLEMSVLYSDEEAGDRFQSKLTLTWSGVDVVQLRQHENWLYGLNCESLPDGRIRTRFHQGLGIEGTIDADSLEASLEPCEEAFDPEEDGWMDIQIA